jgi:hypothetical protein
MIRSIDQRMVLRSPLGWIPAASIVIGILLLTHTGLSTEFGFGTDDTYVNNERAASGTERPAFAWGADLGTDQLQESFDAHAAPLDPWYPLSGYDHGGHFDRSTGMGEPLIGTSWRNRPFHVGWLFGGYIGDDLVKEQAEQHGDIVGGYRLGWDFDHYWGTEARLAFANVAFTEPSDPSTSRSAQNEYWDLNLLHYPWGDSRWRPFVSAGLGLGNFEYTLADGSSINKTLLTVPMAAGMKLYFRNWMALRFTATDNWAVGHGTLDTMHNVMLTADVEMHFGGRRTSYFPYSGSIHMW